MEMPSDFSGGKVCCGQSSRSRRAPKCGATAGDQFGGKTAAKKSDELPKVEGREGGSEAEDPGGKRRARNIERGERRKSGEDEEEEGEDDEEAEERKRSGEEGEEGGEEERRRTEKVIMIHTAGNRKICSFFN